jgi:hypothetical protein
MNDENNEEMNFGWTPMGEEPMTDGGKPPPPYVPPVPPAPDHIVVSRCLVQTINTRKLVLPNQGAHIEMGVVLYRHKLQYEQQCRNTPFYTEPGARIEAIVRASAPGVWKFAHPRNGLQVYSLGRPLWEVSFPYRMDINNDNMGGYLYFQPQQPGMYHFMICLRINGRVHRFNGPGTDANGFIVASQPF